MSLPLGLMSFRRTLSLVVVLLLVLVEMTTVMGLHEMIQKHQTSSYDILLSTFSSGPLGNLSLKLEANLDPGSNRNVDPGLLWFTVVLLNDDQRVSTSAVFFLKDEPELFFFFFFFCFVFKGKRGADEWVWFLRFD